MEATKQQNQAEATTRARQFISKGLTTLWAEQSDQAKKLAIDVLIIGSGYGGAVAAAELAGTSKDGLALNVVVLECGSGYLSGMFPSQVSDLAGHVRFSVPGKSAAAGVEQDCSTSRSAPM